MNHWRALAFRFYNMVQPVACPGLRNSHYAYRDALLGCIGSDTHWLDLGCGCRFLPDWMPGLETIQDMLVSRCKEVVGVDASDMRPHSAGIRKVAGDIEQLPFADESFSLVTANMVVEHVREPEKMLAEAFRVLRPGGILLFHTPNAAYYQVALARLLPPRARSRLAHIFHGREDEDIFPTHYRLNRANWIRSSAKNIGFRVQEIIYVECSAQLILLGPPVVFELLLTRVLRLKLLARFRSNLVAILQKSNKPSLEGAARRVLAEDSANGRYPKRDHVGCGVISGTRLRRGLIETHVPKCGKLISKSAVGDLEVAVSGSRYATLQPIFWTWRHLLWKQRCKL